jgi:hypothetical protein
MDYLSNPNPEREFTDPASAPELVCPNKNHALIVPLFTVLLPGR